MDVQSDAGFLNRDQSLCTLYIFKNENCADLYKCIKLYSQDGEFRSCIQDYTITLQSCSMEKSSSESCASFSSVNEGEFFLKVVKEFVESEGWKPIFSFGKEESGPFSKNIPDILDITINLSLVSIPTLSKDLFLAREFLTNFHHSSSLESMEWTQNSFPSTLEMNFNSSPFESSNGLDSDCSELHSSSLKPNSTDLPNWMEILTAEAIANHLTPEAFPLLKLASDTTSEYLTASDPYNSFPRPPSATAMPSIDDSDPHSLNPYMNTIQNIHACTENMENGFVPLPLTRHNELERNLPQNKSDSVVPSHSLVHLNNSNTSSSIQQKVSVQKTTSLRIDPPLAFSKNSSLISSYTESSSESNCASADLEVTVSKATSSPLQLEVANKKAGSNPLSNYIASDSSNAERSTDATDSIQSNCESNLNRNRFPKSATRILNEMTLDELAEYFNMPINEASKQLGVGLTILKKRCREFNIPRWPHRKVKSIDYLIKNLSSLAHVSAEEANVTKTLTELERQKLSMMENPIVSINDKTKKLRQSCFKMQYKFRRHVSQKLNVTGEKIVHS